MKFNAASLFILFSMILLLSCSKGSSGGYSNNNGNPTGTGNTVSIENMRFSGTVTVKAGSTVTWTNNDNMTHTVTADDGNFTSADMKYGDTYSHTFSTAGTYPYHCKYHTTMTSSVIVN